jgi:hypothetical protein
MFQPKATKASTSSTPTTPAKVEAPKEEPKAAPVAPAASEGTASTQPPASTTTENLAESKATAAGDETKPWNASDALGT